MKYGQVYKELEIGNMILGGPADTRPAFPVGSIFYDHHSIVTDPWKGDFDRVRAARLLETVNAESHRCGLVSGVDIIAGSAEAIERFIEFTVEHTHLPILINSGLADVRIAGLRRCQDLQVLDRTIYASLTMDAEPQELDALKKIRPAGVMILAANTDDPTPEGQVTLVADVFLPMLKEIGVEVPIVDVGVLDPPAVGLTLRAMREIKAAYGFPVGGAFSNAVYSWKVLHQRGRTAVDAALAALAALFRAYDGDFIHYGPIEKAQLAIHAVAVCEVCLGYGARTFDGLSLATPHPLQAMFRE